MANFARFLKQLLESPLWLLLPFCPKILGSDWDLRIVLCHHMNAGDGDTETLPYSKEFKLFALTSSRHTKSLGTSVRV